MYDALEAILLKYLPADKVSRDAAGAGGERTLPRVLVVSGSKEKLDEMKSLLGTRYKGVFVRDEEKARKYLEKHEVELVIRVE